MVHTIRGPCTVLRCDVTCAPCSDLAQPCYAPGVSRSGRLPNCSAQVRRITGEEGVGFGQYLNEIMFLSYICSLSVRIRMYVCRKKYFLKNVDLDEYSKTNSLLLENIYAQVRYCESSVAEETEAAEFVSTTNALQYCPLHFNY